MLVLEVEDTGIGIAQEDQARIFDVFVQAGNTSAQKGTGLGLSITQQFVQLMGGTISVQSTPGKGSLFSVELPVEQVEESDVASNYGDRQVVGLAPGQPDYRILIVEDKKENWLLLQRLLLDSGFQVQVAEDGVQGVEMFRTWQPHLIWMDVRLPVMGGVEAQVKSGFWKAAVRSRLWRFRLRHSPTSEKTCWLRVWMIFCVSPTGARKSSTAWPATSASAIYTGKSSRVRPADPIPAVRPDLTMLPEQLRKELADAVVSLDPGPSGKSLNAWRNTMPSWPRSYPALRSGSHIPKFSRRSRTATLRVREELVTRSRRRRDQSVGAADF